MRQVIEWLIVMMVVVTNVGSFVWGRVTAPERIVYPRVVPGVTFVQPADILQCPRTKPATELWDSICRQRVKSGRVG